MEPDELTEACWQARLRWNRPSSVFSRFWDFRTHLSSPTRAATYLAYNPLYARETFKKQGMYLGYSRDPVHAGVTGSQAGTAGANDSTVRYAGA